MPRGFLLLAFTLALAGCGASEAKAPNPTRPLSQGRAVEVIRRAMKNEHVEPTAGRDEPLAGGKNLHIDVGVAGHAYGVAYITQEDADALGDSLPLPNKKDEKLKLVRVGDGETRVVLLFQQNYLYDDQAGESHEQTTIAAEGSLGRDVQDFITHAKSHNFK